MRRKSRSNLFFDCPSEAVVRVAFTRKQWDELRARIEHLAPPIANGAREAMKDVRSRTSSDADGKSYTLWVLYLTHAQSCALWMVFRPRPFEGLRYVSAPGVDKPTCTCAVCLLMDVVADRLNACGLTGAAHV